MPDTKQKIQYQTYRNPAEGVLDSSTDVVVNHKGEVISSADMYRQPTHPGLHIDTSTNKEDRVESWWHPGSIGDVSQGVVDAVCKIPFKGTPLGTV